MQERLFAAIRRRLCVNKDLLRAVGLEPIVSNDVVLLAPLPQFWEDFQKSPEYADGLPDPLDRYSKRVIGAFADALGVEAVFPSGGPPYPPFLEWALHGEGVYPSPTGMLVHDEFGLWISFRGALRIAGVPKRSSQNPCNDCSRQCLQACPVDAFSTGQYDVAGCREYLGDKDVACWDGCLVRASCPANKIKRDPEQSRFHMQSFAL